jgi:hypothetical protein
VQAAGTVGQGNAWGQTLGDITNMATDAWAERQNRQAWERIYGQGRTPTVYGPGGAVGPGPAQPGPYRAGYVYPESPDDYVRN